MDSAMVVIFGGAILIYVIIVLCGAFVCPNFNEEIILKMAREAKEVGVELFVLDDGWFGKRNDDRRGLGDWFCNLDKIPSGTVRNTFIIIAFGRVRVDSIRYTFSNRVPVFISVFIIFRKIFELICISGPDRNSILL